MGYLLARFAHYYPGLYHTGHWPTRDGVIPFKLFLLLSASVRHLSAEVELRLAHANAYGAVLAHGSTKSDPALRKYTRRLIRLAYPDQ